MSRTSFRVTLVVIGVMAAFIVASADAATVKQCSAAYNKCMDGCDKLANGGDGSPRAKCVGKCGLSLVNCGPWSLPPKTSGMAAPTGTTQPPKGNVGLDKVDVGGVKDPGPGTSLPPKGKVGLDKVNVQGLSSGQTSGDTTPIQRSRGGKKH
ncbi:MAG: hypothetical protein AB1473_20380 [Thermodesulfobacteriota bacterium]